MTVDEFHKQCMEAFPGNWTYPYLPEGYYRPNTYVCKNEKGLNFDLHPDGRVSATLLVRFVPAIGYIRWNSPAASVETIYGESVADVIAAARKRGWLDDPNGKM